MELIKKWWCLLIHPWRWVVLAKNNKLERYCVECNKIVD